MCQIDILFVANLVLFVTSQLSYSQMSLQGRHLNHSARSKTERALESISQIEAMNLDFRLKIDRLREQINPRANSKTTAEGQWTRVQLVSNSSELYQLNCSRPLEELTLKIIIKAFTGNGVLLSLSAKPDLVKIEDCEHKIAGDKILLFRRPPLLAQKTFLSLHSPNDLNLFKLKYEFLAPEPPPTQSNSLKLLPQVSRQLASLRLGEAEESVLQLKRGCSPRSIITFDRSRLKSAKMETIERQKQKLEMARQKRKDIEIFKEKSKSLRSLGRECSLILKDLRQQIATEREHRSQAVHNAALLVFVVKFMIKTHCLADERQRGLQHATFVSKIIKKCSSRIMRLNSELSYAVPKRKQRELLNIYHTTSALAKLLSNKDIRKARTVVVECFTDAMVPMVLNNLLNHAAIYRSKARSIQRFWKQRNQAQLTMFRVCIEHNTKQLLEKHLPFGLIRQQFYQRNMPHNLSWQYLKDSSLKIRHIVNAYQAKLKDIEDTKQINIEIAQFNARSLKKHQKQPLDVPCRPCPPVTRYFRDLSILKSMLRSWFQIEYRRHVRRLKKEGKEPPKR